MLRRVHARPIGPLPLIAGCALFCLLECALGIQDHFGNGIVRVDLELNASLVSGDPIRLSQSCPTLLVWGETLGLVRPLVVQGAMTPVSDWWRDGGNDTFAQFLLDSQALFRTADRGYSLLDGSAFDSAIETQRKVRSTLTQLEAKAWFNHLPGWGVKSVLIRNGALWGIEISHTDFAVHSAAIRKYIPDLQYLALQRSIIAGLVSLRDSGALKGIKYLVLPSAQSSNDAGEFPYLNDLEFLDLGDHAITSIEDGLGAQLAVLKGFAINTLDGEEAVSAVDQYFLDHPAPSHLETFIVRRGDNQLIDALRIFVRASRKTLKTLQLPNRVVSASFEGFDLTDYRQLKNVSIGSGWQNRVLLPKWIKFLHVNVEGGERFWLGLGGEGNGVISRLKELTHLEIDMAESPNGQHLIGVIDQLEHLQHLGIVGTGINGEHQDPLPVELDWKRFRQLRRLMLDHVRPLQAGRQQTGNSYRTIASLPNLRFLLVGPETAGELQQLMRALRSRETPLNALWILRRTMTADDIAARGSQYELPPMEIVDYETSFPLREMAGMNGFSILGTEPPATVVVR